MNNKEFLYKYLNAYAPVGQETKGQKIWVDYVTEYSDGVTLDPYGTAVALLKGDSEINYVKPKVIIEAHCDEIAWIVTQIEDSGLLRVTRHGGSDNMIAPAKTVVIHTHDGEEIRGLFGWPAIHTRSKNVESGYEQHELWIDTGLADKKAVESAGIEVGNIATFDTQLEEIGDYYVGRSLDNKIGGYIIAEVLRKLKKEKVKLPYDLYVVNAVQEEVGLFGATMIAKRLQGDLAIVHDVCHETNTPKYNKAKEGDIKGGKGPCLQYTAQNHRDLVKLIRKVGKENKIDLQLSVGSYGNDTMAFFKENTPTAIISTPLKYMHTPVEMAHKKDVKACIKLYIKLLKELTVDDINKIHKK